MARQYLGPRYDEPYHPDGFHEAIRAAVRPVGYDRTIVESEEDGTLRVVGIVLSVAGMVEGLLFIRLLLQVVGASTISPITGFIFAITRPLAWPFQGIAGSSLVGTTGAIEWASVIALAIYGLAALAVVRALHSPTKMV